MADCSHEVRRLLLNGGSWGGAEEELVHVGHSAEVDRAELVHVESQGVDDPVHRNPAWCALSAVDGCRQAKGRGTRSPDARAEQSRRWTGESSRGGRTDEDVACVAPLHSHSTMGLPCSPATAPAAAALPPPLLPYATASPPPRWNTPLGRSLKKRPFTRSLTAGARSHPCQGNGI